MDIMDTTLPQVSVIGSMLIDERCIGPVLTKVQPEDFISEPYRKVFLAIRKLFTDGTPIDPVTVLNVLQADGSADWYGFLAQCMEMTPTATNVDVYVPILREQARLSRIQAIGVELMSLRDMGSAQEAIARLNALQVDRPGIQITTMEQGLLGFMERQEKKVTYLPWGFQELDGRLHVSTGKFVIIGGYPSHGKTALALSSAYTMSEKYRVGFFSLETDDGTLMDRLVARTALIPMQRIKRNELTEEDYEAVAASSEKIVKHRLEFILAAGMTVADIFATAQSRRYDVIYVDYIQLIRGDRNRGRVEEITGISIDLHTLAQSTGINVIGLSQLSRPEKGGKTQRAPRMSDLRESGQLEQDADVIMMVYRENADNADSRRVLAIEKNKEGELGQVFLNFDGATQTFRRSLNQIPPPARRKEPEYSQVEFHELKEDDSELPF